MDSTQHAESRHIDKAEIVTFSGRWSDPTSWAAGSIPDSSNGLHVRLDAIGSIEDLGSALAPFTTNDITGGSAVGGGAPLFIDGFLDARNVINVEEVQVDGFQQGAAGLHVRHDLVNVQGLDVLSNSEAEIGHHVGSTTFSLGDGTNTLILDNPPKHSLDNEFLFSPGTAKIELGKLQFDQADLIPPVPGAANQESSIQLTHNGAPVYDLTHVGGATSVSFGGVDPTTGRDILLVNSNA